MRIVIGLVGVLLVGGCGDAPQRIGHGFGEEGASTLEIPEDIQQQQAEHLRGINESLEGIKQELDDQDLMRDFPKLPDTLDFPKLPDKLPKLPDKL